ncbi:MAG: HNH endonuclease, partial [Candidatus Dormibacteraeota bacterium]|nr:HNH endonuclease [Candidatus Dormibacteraeota bacterium]
HIVHWTRGGPTDLANLVPLCYRHHWMVHEGGWSLVKTDAGILTIPPPRNRVRRVLTPGNFAVA